MCVTGIHQREQSLPCQFTVCACPHGFKSPHSTTFVRVWLVSRSTHSYPVERKQDSVEIILAASLLAHHEARSLVQYDEPATVTLCDGIAWRVMARSLWRHLVGTYLTSLRNWSGVDFPVAMKGSKSDNSRPSSS